ncbi:M15 family metallopeptidase [Gracilibacillus salinarum]|uniref:D-alanyl-D-alanine dipeptidase n=1 Tax=Gracilibacillus salinarum TaxID=2932255 RepID=A0ABY4GIF1_9BACI|nr:M15 family metallopeptidase [Gracilibacillus salinarum]UOQ83765.1 M15 family metallopeptidase [Gracilibacillus salinarum]
MSKEYNSNRIIPEYVPPAIQQHEVHIEDNGEPLISISEYQSNYIVEDPMYYKWQLKGALSHCYLRQSVLDLLAKAARQLPKGYQFVIWDGYRPFDVQKEIYDQYFNKIQQQFPDHPSSVWHEKTKLFVSYPSIDERKPAPHITGGAVDLTIRNEKKQLLDFGTAFDDFTEKANTAYFEKLASGQKLSKQEQTILENRRLLYYLLKDVGFTNFHQEWWHFDYGDQWWAQQAGYAVAKYGVAPFKEGC